jgi:MFS superfamily sulfate permease-like transporter
VVAAEPITDVDTTAADFLLELDRWLNERGQSLVFAELKDPVRRKIEVYGLTAEIEPSHFFPTVDAAVDAFRAQTGAHWVKPTGTAAAASTVVPRQATPLETKPEQPV